MQPIDNLSSSHSNASGGDFGAKSRSFGRIRPLVAVLALLGLLVAGRFVIQPEQPTLDRSAIVLAGNFVPTSDLPTIQGHRASILQELIDILQEIIDVLDGRTPLPYREPDSPTPGEEPVLTDEERDEGNEAVDDAVDEGAEDPGDRLDATWNYDQTRTFLQTVIDLIDDFQAGAQ